MPDRQPHHAHDKGYRELLSSKRAFLELLRTFVREDWAKDIDEESLVRVEKSYILQDFSEKEADIVYRLRLRGTEVISAALSFKEMLAGYRQFEEHVLDFRYILFDVNRYDAEELYRAANLVASIFALDQKMDAEELVGRLRKLAGSLKNLSRDEFRRFGAWLGHVLKARLPDSLRDKVDRIIGEVNPWEVEKMITNLEITLEEMQQQAEMRGLMKGRAEGEAIGKAKGKVEKAQDAICKYLKRRFGAASEELQRVVQGVTSLEALDGVMEELFAADTLEEARAIIGDGMGKLAQ
ncbi:transposase [Desulfofundulus thermobenzoicus]|uniref:Transposase n=1 Tax=Desulfofundulus thermobenzoicus TaxID=29376 RepID=A0A6N7IUF6_9FIRM|nr:transposase [Desulfofundulus thermobenzoicus]MQL53724.1 transposase [Desulfofundulus thermobenzoicus]